MPPGPAYNALAVLYSLARILEHVAQNKVVTTAHALGVTGNVLHRTRGAAATTQSSSAATASSPDASFKGGSTIPPAPAAAKNETEIPTKPELTKGQKRRIQQQLDEEEFRAILGKRWVDGVLVDGSLPFSVSNTQAPIRIPSRTEQAESSILPTMPRVAEAIPLAAEPPVNIETKAQGFERTGGTPILTEQEPAPSPIAPTATSSDIPYSEPFVQPTFQPSPSDRTVWAVIPPAALPSVESADSRDLPLPSPSPSPASPLKKTLTASKVPSSRIGRLLHYGGLAASLGYGAAAELLRGSDSSSNPTGNVMLSEANIKRLVGKLTQMRGAALKLGQFMSIQDTHLLPPELDQIFRRVQDSAHYMPDWQMEKVLSAAYGPNWYDPTKPDKTVFLEFERIPFAAASIGQVHRARLAPRFCPVELLDEHSKQHGLDVAVKVQFPNIVNSIKSDLGYVKMLLSVGGLLPKGLFLDRTIAVMSAELTDECSYTREASFLKQFRSKEFLGNDTRYKVPWVWKGSTDEVLVMERVGGVGVGDVTAGLSSEGSMAEHDKQLSQRDRDDIASRIIELCLKELFEFRTMQTDPNWTNFLWNKSTRQIELVDFGATRAYSKKFMDSWLRLLQAAASDDKQKCIEESVNLGYLTGEEDELMLDAHVRSLTLLATPFKSSTTQPFAFGPHSTWAEVTKEIRSLIPVMVNRRLTPPPKETYSLNRKLSGAFLLAARLDAKVDTKAIWDKVISKYEFGGWEEEEGNQLAKDVD